MKEINSNYTSNDKPKEDLLTLFKIKQNNTDLDFNDISNIDKINGFREVKLGLDIDSVDYSNFTVDSSLSEYNIIRLLDNNIFMDDIKIGIHRIRFIKLYFFKNKLNEIEIEYGKNGFDALSMLINIYGPPTNYYLLKEKIQNELEITNRKNSNITDPVLKGLNPIIKMEDIVLENTPYKWDTDKIVVSYILKSYIRRNSSYSPKEYHYSNLLTIRTAFFQDYFLRINEEINRNKEEIKNKRSQEIIKEKLNEF